MTDERNTWNAGKGTKGQDHRYSYSPGTKGQPSPVPQDGTLPQSGKSQVGTEQGTNESRAAWPDRASLLSEREPREQAEKCNMRDTHENSWGEAATTPTPPATPNMRGTHDSSRGARAKTETQILLHSLKVGVITCLVLGNLILLGNVVALNAQLEDVKATVQQLNSDEKPLP